jgi:two-component system OmpR family response regulator
VKKVLVLEDDRSIREMIVAVLVETGYAVAAAANGAQGLERCREFAPDVIVLDLMMPEVDGFEFLERQPREGCAAPVVVLSAGHHRDMLPPDAPVSAFIEKPFPIDRLIDAVAAHAQRPDGDAGRPAGKRPN